MTARPGSGQPQSYALSQASCHFTCPGHRWQRSQWYKLTNRWSPWTSYFSVVKQWKVTACLNQGLILYPDKRLKGVELQCKYTRLPKYTVRHDCCPLRMTLTHSVFQHFLFFLFLKAPPHTLIRVLYLYFKFSKTN